MKKEQSKVSVVHVALRRAILEQAIAPAAKLPEDTIGEQFGVSRTIVRRALERLAAEELVDIRPNRGATVISPTLEEAKDLFAFRIELEDIVIRRLCGRLTVKEIRRLERSIDHEQAALNEGKPDYIRLSAEFHLILAEMCGSPLLERHLRQLIWRSAIVLRLYGRPTWGHCNVDEHRALISALAAGNAKICRRIMAAHLNHVLERALQGEKQRADGSLHEVLQRYA